MRAVIRLPVLLTVLAALGLAGCGQPGDTAVGNRFEAADAALRAAGRLKVDRLARDVALSPDLLANHFEKIAFGEEFRLEGGRTISVPQSPDAVLRRWERPILYALPDVATREDHQMVSELVTRLKQRTGLEIRPSGEEEIPNLFIRILTSDDRAELASIFRTTRRTSPLAELFLTWAASPNWPCAGEIYFPDKGNTGAFAIEMGMIYIRDEVRGVSRQSCLEEEITQSLGLTRDDPSVRPSIFNDDEEFALLTRHDELLLQMLYDDALAPGMDRETAMPLARGIAVRVLVP